MSFKGTSGAKMVCTRSLQLTVQKATRKQKTLEGQLLMIKDGERTAVSSRVAELDQIMPQYLGVSKAILDSVIFCHQEESMWPMSEPGVLKKKFDEIFEALKYTKAIENIKLLRKKQNELLAQHKIMEQNFKTDKDRADRVCNIIFSLLVVLIMCRLRKSHTKFTRKSRPCEPKLQNLNSR
jgi:DNA repair protein RAD50